MSFQITKTLMVMWMVVFVAITLPAAADETLSIGTVKALNGDAISKVFVGGYYVHLFENNNDDGYIWIRVDMGSSQYIGGLWLTNRVDTATNYNGASASIWVASDESADGFDCNSSSSYTTKISDANDGYEDFYPFDNGTAVQRSFIVTNVIKRYVLIKFYANMWGTLVPPNSYRESIQCRDIALTTINLGTPDPCDATSQIANAITDGYNVIILPDNSGTWKTNGIELVDNLQIILGQNVVWEQIRGSSYFDPCLYMNNCLIYSEEKENIKIMGSPGSTIRMFKQDFHNGEWRHCIRLMSCYDVSITGVWIEGAAGDCINVGGGWDANVPSSGSKNITIDNITCYMPARNGLSLINGENILIKNSTFADAGRNNPVGVAKYGPWAGIDLEPDYPWQELINIDIDDCTFIANLNFGLIVEIAQLTTDSSPIDISIQRPHVISSEGTGITISGKDHARPNGCCDVYDANICGTAYAGIAVRDWGRIGGSLGFFGCKTTNCNIVGGSSPEAKAPFVCYHRYIEDGANGNVLFSGCRVVNNNASWAFAAIGWDALHQIDTIAGDITVPNSDFGGRYLSNAVNVSLSTIKSASQVVPAGYRVTPVGGDGLNYSVVGGYPLYQFIDTNNDGYARFVIDLGTEKRVDKLNYRNRRDTATNYNAKYLKVRVASNESSTSFKPFDTSAYGTIVFNSLLDKNVNTANTWRYANITNFTRRYLLIEVYQNFLGNINSGNNADCGDIGVTLY